MPLIRTKPFRYSVTLVSDAPFMPFLFASLFAGTQTNLVTETILWSMATADVQPSNSTETKHSTKRVFMRAEQGDIIRVKDISSDQNEVDFPNDFTVVKRDLTYFGPKLRLEPHSNDDQYRMTIPGPNSEAVLWCQSDFEWINIARVSVDFAGSYPQYDICLHCNEPLSTVEHRRRSIIGVCSDQ